MGTDMRLRRILPATLASLGLALVASATQASTNLVQNGNFSANTLPGSLTPAGASGAEFDQEWNYNGAVTNWSTANGPSGSNYNLYFFGPNANSVDADTRYTSSEPQHLNSNFTGPIDGAFVGLDGDPIVNGYLEQTISGLVVGTTYKLSFYWAGAELSNRVGYQTVQLTGDLGGSAFATEVYNNSAPAGSPGSFSGWTLENFNITANSTSEVLRFLAAGTPSANLPPFALLDSVSLTASAPEPSTWAMLALGFGGLGAAAALRRRKAVVAA